MIYITRAGVTWSQETRLSCTDAEDLTVGAEGIRKIIK